jgi:serine/threonine-protein kinase
MKNNSAEHLRVIEGEGGREPSKPPPDPLIGRTIEGRYSVESVLGEGGMGIVYKARHTVLNKLLAVKVLRAEVSKDGEIMMRFRQEAQSASEIGNEHIIDITDFGTLPNGSTYFVMEYLNGVSLTKGLEQSRPFPSNRTIHIAKQLCRALGAAHERGIVHRDLKPDNIYLVPRGGDRDFVKVLDFGIAKVGGASTKLTKAGQVFGTPHYMSPEQCAGSAVDNRTDIYALGVILYEMASGRVPFDADNLMGILTKHLYEQPIPPHTLPPPIDVPPALEAVIMKCLSKTAEARYQNMQEMYEDLERLEQGQTPQAVMDAVNRASGPQGVGSVGTLRDATGRSALQVGVGEVGEERKSKLPLILVAAAVILGGGGIALAIALSGGDPPPRTDIQPVVRAPAPPPVVAQEPEIPPQELGAGSEAPSTPEAVMVTLESTPPEAVVTDITDPESPTLLGPTPITVERPTARRQQRRFQFELAGFETKVMGIASRTSADRPLMVTLTAERTPSKRVRPRPPAGQGQQAATPNPTPTPTPTEQPRRPPALTGNEVLDPWQN